MDQNTENEICQGDMEDLKFMFGIDSMDDAKIILDLFKQMLKEESEISSTNDGTNVDPTNSHLKNILLSLMMKHLAKEE